MEIDIKQKIVLCIGYKINPVDLLNAGAKKIIYFTTEKQNIFRNEIEWHNQWNINNFPYADILFFDDTINEYKLSPDILLKYKEYYIKLHKHTKVYYKLRRFLIKDGVNINIADNGNSEIFVKKYNYPRGINTIKDNIDIAIISSMGTAFEIESNMLAAGLKSEGIKAKVYNDKVYSYFSGLHVFNPFWTSQLYHEKKHTIGNSVIYTVADGSSLHKDYINFLSNDVAQLIIPTEYSINAFNGYNRPIYIVRHAIPNLGNFNIDKKYDIFMNAPHSLDRKGFSEALEAFNKANINNNLKGIAHLPSGLLNNTYNFNNINIIRGKISYYERIKAMAESKIFLYPVRGGAWELPILEAAALGLTIVMPEIGPWCEFMQKCDYYPIQADGEKILYPSDNVQNGYGLLLDKESIYNQLLKAIDKPLNINRGYYAEKYSPQNMAKEFLKKINY